MFSSHFKQILISAILLMLLNGIHGQWNAIDSMKNILERLQKEKRYESVVLMQTKNVECFQEHIHEMAQVPIFILDAQKNYYLKGQFNSEMIAIVCLQNAEKLELLYTLANYFQHMRHNRVIILVNENYENVRSDSSKKILKTCHELDLFFVNLFYADFYESFWYLSYAKYPQFELKNHSLQMKDNFLYPTGIRNFSGEKLKMSCYARISQNYLNYDKSTKNITKATGILGWFMDSYASVFNVSLSYEVSYSHIESMNKIDNYSMIISGKIFDPTTDTITNCVLLHVGWLVVLMPMEKSMKTANFLLPVLWQTIKIFGLVAIITICALIAILEKRKISDIRNTYLVIGKMDCIRGMLGYSFTMRRHHGFLLGLAYMLIILQGFFNASIYPANLGTRFTIMPKEKPVHTFDELLARGYPKIFKANSIKNSTITFVSHKKYAALYEHSNSTEDIFYDNVLPNPKYAYDLISDHWSLIDYVQKYYKIKLFRLERNMMYPVPAPIIMGLIFPPNSPFLKSIRLSYLRAQEAGLLNVWLLRNRSIIIPKTNTEAQPLTIHDYDELFFLYIFMSILALIIFIIEIYMRK